MGRFVTGVFVTLMGAALMAACAVPNTVKNAQLSFNQAKSAGAERTAPYQYYAAEAHLELAKHELSEVDLAAAREYAEKSMSFSGEAQKKAGGGAR